MIQHFRQNIKEFDKGINLPKQMELPIINIRKNSQANI